MRRSGQNRREPAGLGFAAGSGGFGFRFGFGVFSEPQVVGGLESAGEHVFGGFGEDDMGGAVFAPAAVDGQKNIREVLNE